MKNFLIDIDGTICYPDIKNEDSHLYPTAEVIPGSLEQINKWHEEGHHITFFTAREEKDREVTLKWLDEKGFKYHGLIMNKPRCLNTNDEYVWIDNRKVRGITYKSVWGDLKTVTKNILTFGE
jgi:uncharacterized HAD superfamily protein